MAVGTPGLAIERSLEFRPDVLVVDWLLGDKQTGADLVVELRARLPHLQVVVMSGLGTQMGAQPGGRAANFSDGGQAVRA